MMDLFPEGEDEDYNLSNNLKEESSKVLNEDSKPLDPFKDGIDITSIEALEELAKLNPNLLLPYLLPINEKFTGANESVIDIFNERGVQFMHVQMPNTLPSINKELEVGEKLDMNTGAKQVYQSSVLQCLPSGKLGKLRVHKSGKIKLVIDGHEFNFSRGNGSTCKQQVACHLEENNEFLFLGNFHNRFVVSPDLSHLTSNLHT